MSRAAARLLAVECAVLPGGHTAALDVPDAFAGPLRELIRRRGIRVNELAIKTRKLDA